MTQDDISKALQETFEYYFENVVEQVSTATYLSGGKRPEGLTNEIYSAFHHIARAFVFFKNDIPAAVAQIQKARDSHLKRASLDSYKITLNSFYLEDKRLLEVLDYLVLVEDYEKYIPDAPEALAEIRILRNAVRSQYQKARSFESQGDSDKAIVAFNAAVEQACELSQRITLFTENRVYLLAVAREAHERKEKKTQEERNRKENEKNRRNVVWASIISAVTSAILTGAVTFTINFWCTHHGNRPEPKSLKSIQSTAIQTTNSAGSK